MNKTELLLSVPVLSCCFARTGLTTTQNSKTRTPKNSDPSVGTTKTQGQFTCQKRRNGSGRTNKHRFRQNLPVYMRKFCKGTDKRMTRSSENRGTDKDRLHVIFVTGTDRAIDLKLLRLVRIRFRPYIKRQWMNPYYFCVSSKEKNTNFDYNNNVSDNSGKCF